MMFLWEVCMTFHAAACKQLASCAGWEDRGDSSDRIRCHSDRNKICEVLGFWDVILCVIPLRSLGAKLDQHCPSDLVKASMLQDTHDTKNFGTATTITKVLVANELDSIYQLSFIVGATELLIMNRFFAIKLPRTTMCTSRCKSNDMCLCTSLWNVLSRCLWNVLGGIFFWCGESSCKKPSKNRGGFFCLECFLCEKKPIQHPRILLISIIVFFCFDDWLIRRKDALPSKTSCLPKSKPNEKRKSWGECHWNLGEGDWCASGETGGSATGLAFTSGANVSFFFFFFWEPWTAFFWVLGVVLRKRQHFKHMKICSDSQQTLWNLRRFWDLNWL